MFHTPPPPRTTCIRQPLADIAELRMTRDADSWPPPNHVALFKVDGVSGGGCVSGLIRDPDLGVRRIVVHLELYTPPFVPSARGVRAPPPGMTHDDEQFWMDRARRVLAALVLGKVVLLQVAARTPWTSGPWDDGRVVGGLFAFTPEPPAPPGSVAVPTTRDIQPSARGRVETHDLLRVDAYMARVLPSAARTPVPGEYRFDLRTWSRERAPQVDLP